MQPPSKDWGVPAEYKTKKNPLAKTDANLSLGKQSYNKYCAGCHGLSGKGDGEKSKSLANVKPENLTLDNIKKESDGEHFFKIKYGRDNLHSFKGKMDDEAIWATVHYMNTFK
jgi:mono/diheme cytochrome c family protein